MSGHPRSFLETKNYLFKNFKYIKGLSKLDFFLHMYDSDMTDKVLETYKPVDWVCEKEYLILDKFKDKYPYFYPRHHSENYQYKTLNQFRNNLIAFNLIQENEYDVVFKFRYDLILNQEYDFSCLDMNYLNIPFGEDHIGVNDRSCISSYSNMKNYYEFYKQIKYTREIIAETLQYLNFGVNPIYIYTFVIQSFYDETLLYDNYIYFIGKLRDVLNDEKINSFLDKIGRAHV